MEYIYLDNNATTPLHPEVAEAMAACYRDGYANAASPHGLGQRARRLVEDAREGIAELLGAVTDTTRSDYVVFTSGGTEANNLALRGLAGASGGQLVISAIEHPSVSEVVDQMAREGFEARRVPVTHSGAIDGDQLSSRLTEDTRLVSLIWGNNETGILQTMAPIADLCQKRNIPLHTDAVQVVGKLPIDFHKLGLAAMSFSAHKFHGPRGIGALLVRGDIVLQPILRGGFQQLGRRAGTEPVELIVGMFAALRIWHHQSDSWLSHMKQLRDQLEGRFRQADASIVIHSTNEERLPHTTSVSFLGVDRQPLVIALDLAGVACSTGSACASGSSEPSPVLLAMGLKDDLIGSALRFSVSALTSAADVDLAASRILQVYRDLRQKNETRKGGSGPRKPVVKGV
ncbi:MAG TPA: cysteine desulfurase family protein [Pirellulaceae bacterium]|nr:cysteine desulfurase family protein [Pirellulaceae bacterium]